MASDLVNLVNLPGVVEIHLEKQAEYSKAQRIHGKDRVQPWPIGDWLILVHFLHREDDQLCLVGGDWNSFS